MGVEQDFIKDVDKLVPRPDIALDVLQLAYGEDCDFNVLSSTIETDPSLTANMLQLANSAYFGHMRKISSIHDIIIRLGLESVKLIAITSASIGLLKNPQDAYNLDAAGLWQHSQATAILSSIIGRYAKVKDGSAVYTAALLHDIGKVVLNRPLQIALSNNTSQGDSLSFIELENKLLETDHAKVGMFLLEKWGLPAAITVPVGFHHHFEKALIHKRSTLVVYLANALVEGMGFKASEEETTDIDDIVDERIYSAVPGFHKNMETIIDEFYDQMNDMETLTFD